MTNLYPSKICNDGIDLIEKYIHYKISNLRLILHNIRIIDLTNNLKFNIKTVYIKNV